MSDEESKSRFTKLADYISGQDIAQYLSLEKLKSIVFIIVAVAAPIVFLVLQYFMLNAQVRQAAALEALVEVWKQK